MINADCPICHSRGKTLFILSRPTVHALDGLPGVINKCERCGLIFKTFDRHPATLYDDEYASRFIDLKEYSGTHVVNFFNIILQPSRERINTTNPRLLDIGSGKGVMLETATNLGYQATGVELSRRLTDDSVKKGYTVKNIDVNELSTQEKYDTITMMDIIEHLEDPLAVLNKLKSILNEHGELIVYTPNHDSLIVKMAQLLNFFGVTSPVENIFACVHTCFFSTKTLKMILHRAGYDIFEIRHFRYDTSRPGQRISFITKLGIAGLEKIGMLFGYSGFRVVMYAKPIR